MSFLRLAGCLLLSIVASVPASGQIAGGGFGTGGNTPQEYFISVVPMFNDSENVFTVIDSPSSGDLSPNLAEPGMIYTKTKNAFAGFDQFSFTSTDENASTVVHHDIVLDQNTAMYSFVMSYLVSYGDLQEEQPQDEGPIAGVMKVAGVGNANNGDVVVNNVTFVSTTEGAKGKVRVRKVQKVWDAVVDKANEKEDGVWVNDCLHHAIEAIANDGTPVVIKVSPQDKNVIIGSYNLGVIDFEDFDGLPTGEGPAISKEELVLHEVVEQWLKNKDGLEDLDDDDTTVDDEDFTGAHNTALQVEAMLEGWEREPGDPVVTNLGPTTVFTQTHCNGTDTVEVSHHFVNGVYQCTLVNGKRQR